jgi:hypothetical protein
MSANQSTTTVTTQQGWKITFPLPDPKGLRRLQKRRVDTLKREIGQVLSEGYHTRCPLTGKHIRLYRHSIVRCQLWSLQSLANKSRKLGKVYLHLEHFTHKRDGSFARLMHWGLIAPLTPDAALEGEKINGVWRVTKLGHDWLAGAVSIPRQVAILLGKALGPVDRNDQVYVNQITTDFSKDELLNPQTAQRALTKEA